MWYFDKSNQEAQEKLNATIKAQRLEYNQRVQEDIQTTEIIRNRKTSREQYLKTRWTKQVDSIWLNHKKGVFKFTENPTKEELEKEEQFAIDYLINN